MELSAADVVVLKAARFQVRGAVVSFADIENTVGSRAAAVHLLVVSKTSAEQLGLLLPGKPFYIQDFAETVGPSRSAAGLQGLPLLCDVADGEPEEGEPGPSQGRIDSLLDSALLASQQGDSAAAIAAVRSLKRELGGREGRTSRQRGGFEYFAEYKLDAVMVTDMMRSADNLGTLLDRCSTMMLSPALCEHAKQQRGPVPSTSRLYVWKVDMDLASMLWARDHVFTGEYICHLRFDSSPQFGRDYLLGEADVLAGIPAVWPVDDLRARLLPPQNVGSRASSAAFKMQKVRRMLALECADLPGLCARVYSLLTDMGTESCIWMAPTLCMTGAAVDDNEALQWEELRPAFPNALPIPDADHGLHHVPLLFVHSLFSADLYMRIVCLPVGRLVCWAGWSAGCLLR